MAQSKKDSSRKHQAEQYKAQVKQKAERAAIPHQYMIPQTEWQSTDDLALRGDLAEAFEKELVHAYESLQKAGQVFQQFLASNIQTGKVKLKYIWNNGDAPTEEEVKNWIAMQQHLQQAKNERKEVIEKELQAEAERMQNESTTGLVTPGGAPLSEENLEKEKSGLII